MSERTNVSNIGAGREFRSYKIDDSTITYDATKANGSAQIGLAVTFSAADTVALAADANAVIGKLIKVEADNKATVQTDGTMTLAGGTGATLTLGTPIVGALGADNAKGYIRSAASAQAAELLVARGRIENSGTATAVIVTL